MMRRVIAAAFLIFLLVEWGSHGLAFSHASSTDGAAIYHSQDDHEDPCKTLIQCPDGKQGQDRPGVRYDGGQHKPFFDGGYEIRFVGFFIKPPLVERDRVDRILRSINPPFHPPESTRFAV